MHTHKFVSSPGNGAVHLAMGMYDRGARNLQLSLANVTFPVLLCFFLFAKMCMRWRVVFQIRCRKESFLSFLFFF